jgi:hypothetical protein
VPSALVLAASIVLACSSEQEEETVLPREQLLDPAKCGSCHVEQYREWSGSMHAYAADDPVFLAMNARLQRETGGQLKGFCVQCHAPMALAEGKTQDGLNLHEVPQSLKGVTCYFCHNVEKVEGTHDNALVLGHDSTMRGPPFERPARNGVHKSKHSNFLDGDRTDSARMCGACHDIVSPAGTHIERTFAEWQGSVFSKEFDPKNPSLPTGATCVQCHMPSRGEGPVTPNSGRRPLHAHTFAGVDVALTPWPEAEAQKAEIDEFLSRTVQSALCVNVLSGSSQIAVVLHNLGAGHAFPSGASSDRRVWLEVVAYRGGEVIRKSGVVPEGTAVAELPVSDDPDLLLFHDCHFDKEGKETHLFGHAADYEGRRLDPNTTFQVFDPAFYKVNMVRTFPYEPNGVIDGVPDRVTMRTLMTPIGLEVIDDLITSKDLDPAIRAKIPTFQVGETVEWTPAKAAEANLDMFAGGTSDRYRCVTASNAGSIVAADKTPIPKSDRCR